MSVHRTPQGNVTISMVAAAAGVSTATVSHVINQTRYVSEETRERVLKAVAELNFRPNIVARSLRKQNSDTIGLIISDVSNVFFTAVIRGVEDVARQNHYNVLLCNTDEDPERERYYVETMLQRQVTQLIMAPAAADHQYLRDLVQQGARVVFLDRREEGLGIPSVTLDNRRAAFDATMHLIGLGHRRIGLVAGLPGLSTTQGRVAGYQEALAEAGVKHDPALVFMANSRIDGGYDGTLALLDREPPPTALFVTNGLMTIGVVQALRERGLETPNDIALVGFDEFPWSGAFRPYLTTVAQPTYELGAEAARRLIGPQAQAPKDVVLPPRLIVRESCGAGGLSKTEKES